MSAPAGGEEIVRTLGTVTTWAAFSVVVTGFPVKDACAGVEPQLTVYVCPPTAVAGIVNLNVPVKVVPALIVGLSPFQATE